MSVTTRLGLGALGAALVLGMLADGLLRTLPWGLNVVLWVGALTAVAATLAGWQGVALSGGGRWSSRSSSLLGRRPRVARFGRAPGNESARAVGLLALLALRSSCRPVLVDGVGGRRPRSWPACTPLSASSGCR